MGAGQSGGFEVGGSSMGYQVLRVYPNSPGSRAGLKAYFDFIVAINNTRFDKENGALREILKASVDQKLKMVVFNTRTKKVREVEIVPSTNWGGNGLLGVSIKHSSFDKADERVWHVVEVENGSPAQQAGFKANEDYVIGSDSILQENDDLYNLIETHEGKALKLFVYNVNQDNCREVICHPNSKWGGRGYLGCEFGHGLLHRIPYDGSGDDGSDNPKASLIRNQQQPAMQDPSQLPPTKQMKNLNFGSFGGLDNNNVTGSSTSPAQHPSANSFSFQSQLMNKQPARTLDTPGYHKFQQALLGQSALQPNQQQQQQQQQQSTLAQQPAVSQTSAPSQFGSQLSMQQKQSQPLPPQPQNLEPAGYNAAKQQSPPDQNGPPIHLQLAPQTLPPPPPPQQQSLQEPSAAFQSKDADPLGYPMPPRNPISHNTPPPPPLAPQQQQQKSNQAPAMPPTKGLDTYPTPPFDQTPAQLPPPPPPQQPQQLHQPPYSQQPQPSAHPPPPPANRYPEIPSYQMYQQVPPPPLPQRISPPPPPQQVSPPPPPPPPPQQQSQPQQSAVPPPPPPANQYPGIPSHQMYQQVPPPPPPPTIQPYGDQPGPCQD